MKSSCFCFKISAIKTVKVLPFPVASWWAFYMIPDTFLSSTGWWNTISLIFLFVCFFPPRFYQVALPHLCSFVWQVPYLYRCSPWYRWCPLHVLPLLYLRPNRKMSRSDHSAVQAPHCGVDEFCDCISCSQEGDYTTAILFVWYINEMWFIHISWLPSPVFCNDT